jgi:HK97 family phage major capsid protein
MTRRYETRAYSAADITVQDLSNLSPADLIRAQDEIRDRLRDIHQDETGQLRDKIADGTRAEFDRLLDLDQRIDAHLRIHGAVGTRGMVHGTGGSIRHGYSSRAAAERVDGYDATPPRVAEARDAALRMIDDYCTADVLSAAAADRLDTVLRTGDPQGCTARYLTAAGDHAYRAAFAKMLADPVSGHLRFSPEEVEAVRAVSQVQAEMRAMGEGSGAAGAFLLPVQLDPTIMLSSAGVLNPIRSVASVETIGAYQWKGVSSAGVTAAYAAEAAEAGDNSPTLAQPVITPQRGQCFVPFSREVSQDWDRVQAELARLIADGQATVDATMFLTGNGTNQPFGILGGDATYSLTTTQRILTNTTATTAVADPWNFKAAIPARWLNSATFAAAPATWDTIYRFVGGNSTEPYQFDGGERSGNFLGRPKVEWSTMATTTTTTGSKIMIGGDFKAGYKIVDRLGMEVEIVPHLFGSNNRPTGQRGAFGFWRTGAAVVVQNALRYLEVK